MCMFCAAIPVAGAVGARLNVEQMHQHKKRQIELHSTQVSGPFEGDKPVLAITSGVIILLLVGSVVYHTTMFGN